MLIGLKNMLADTQDGTVLSFKRVASAIAFSCLVFAFFVDLFTEKVVSQFVFDGMMWIVIAGFGFTGLEKFAPKSPPAAQPDSKE